jgi:N4-gp56 family major capsid protein
MELNMAIVSYDVNTPRIAKTKGEILKHAIPRMVLSITGRQHRIGRNMSDTVVFRRWLPFGGATTNSTTINDWVVDPNTHLTTDGVTPIADTITPQDITVQLNQYSVLYAYTDKTAELYEDDIPTPMKKQAGQRMGLVKELLAFGIIKASTNKFFAGGTSRATVDATVTLNRLRNITRSLEANRADQITEVLKASHNYNTSPVESGYLVFMDTDLAHDVREIEGFTKAAEYGEIGMKAHPRELGAVDEYRFISSPEFKPVLAGGAALGSTGLLSVGGANVDIYSLMVIADDAWGDVALRGLDGFSLTHLPHDKKDKQDPLGQRGYVGGKFWAAPFMQNDGWAAILECGATELADS